MYSLSRISSYVQLLFRSDDVHILSIVDNLAQEWYILERENGKFFLLDIITKDVPSLEIETTLAEDSTDIGSFLKIWFNLLQDLHFCLSRRANDNYLSSRDNILSVFGTLVDLSLHYPLMLPSRFGSVSQNLVLPNFRPS